MATYYKEGTLPSLHLLAGSARVQIVLFAAAAVAAALLAVGWRTRLAAYELWLCRQWNEVGKSGPRGSSRSRS